MRRFLDGSHARRKLVRSKATSFSTDLVERHGVLSFCHTGGSTAGLSATGARVDRSRWCSSVRVRTRAVDRKDSGGGREPDIPAGYRATARLSPTAAPTPAKSRRSVNGDDEYFGDQRDGYRPDNDELVEKPHGYALTLLTVKVTPASNRHRAYERDIGQRLTW